MKTNSFSLNPHDPTFAELLVMIEVSRLQLFPQNNEYSSSSSLLVPLKDICVGAIHIFDPNERILTLKQKIKHQLLTDFNLYPFAITAASATSTSEFDDENKTNNTSMFSKLKSSLRALIAKQDIESLRLYRKSTRYGLDIPIGAGQNDTMVIHHYGENDKNDNNDNNYIIYISPYNKEGRW